MMNRDLGTFLSSLDDEIERKCFEIRQKRTEGLLKRFFIAACALFIAVPFLLVFAGVNLIVICLPGAGFLAVSLCILTPVLSGGLLGGAAK